MNPNTIGASRRGHLIRQEVFGLVKRNLSGAERRRDAPEEVRGSHCPATKGGSGTVGRSTRCPPIAHSFLLCRLFWDQYADVLPRPDVRSKPLILPFRRAFKQPLQAFAGSPHGGVPLQPDAPKPAIQLILPITESINPLAANNTNTQRVPSRLPGRVVRVLVRPRVWR